MSLTQAIEDQIQQHLPALAAGELKTFIAKAEETAKELERARERLNSLEKRLDEANAKLEQHRSLDDKQNALNTQTRDLEKRELQLRMDTAMNRALVAEAKLEGAMDVTTLVFRNVVVNRSVLERVAVPVAGQERDQYGSGGMVPHVQQHDQTSTVTETTS